MTSSMVSRRKLNMLQPGETGSNDGGEVSASVDCRGTHSGHFRVEEPVEFGSVDGVTVSSHLSGGSLVREFTSSRVIRVGSVSRVDRVRVRVSVRFSGRYKNLGPPFIGSVRCGR